LDGLDEVSREALARVKKMANDLKVLHPGIQLANDLARGGVTAQSQLQCNQMAAESKAMYLKSGQAIKAWASKFKANVETQIAASLKQFEVKWAGAKSGSPTGVVDDPWNLFDTEGVSPNADVLVAAIRRIEDLEAKLVVINLSEYQ